MDAAGASAGQRRRTRTFRRWGGWGSNPGPADYESDHPISCSIASELGKLSEALHASPLFRQVLGMIRLLAAVRPRPARPGPGPQPDRARGVLYGPSRGSGLA